LLSASYDHIDRGGLQLQQTFSMQNASNSPKVFPTPGISGTDLARPIGVFGRLTGTTSSFGDVSLQGGLQQADSNGEFQLGSILTGRTREAIRNLWVEGQHNGRWTKLISTTLTLGYSHGAPTGNDRLYLTSTSLPETYNSYFTRNFGYDAVDGKASLTITPRTNLRFTAGVDLSRESHDALSYLQHYVGDENGFVAGQVVPINPDNGPQNISLTKIAPNLHASWDPTTNMRVSGDGRVDFINLFDKQFSWRGSYGIRILPKLVAKVIAGRAFQTPSTVFLYAHSGFGTSDIIGARNLAVAANPLVPQTVQSYELVLNYLIGEHVVVNLAGYIQSIENQITTVTTGGPFRAVNGSADGRNTQDSKGGEVNITARFWRLEPYVRLSQQWFGPQPSRGAFDRGPIIPPSLVPAFWAMAGLRATVPSPRLTFDATWRGVGERGASTGNIFLNSGTSYALPGYYKQFDLAATATLSAFGGKGHDTRVTFAIRNLLDQKHNEPGFGGIDIPSLGRIFQLGLSQQF